ncbi:MAG: UDP-N-acetylmuramoyl-L-alanine--D-glutamate ligase [Clostridia bacterium]|nr:UDP-N-acetylmuramoyl-L-alanine--D-glutamate ligase [Clostridia bacterium]
MTDFNPHNKKVLVVGAGISGLAACRLLLQKGAQVSLADCKSREELPQELNKLQAQGLRLILNNELPQTADYAFVIKSPGVAHTTPLLKMLHGAKIPVISELELAYQYSKSPFVAITGTNGKTTTTTLVGEIFADAGLNTLVGGNIGLPLADLAETHQGVIVVEASSFQLEDTVDFRPQIALMLNLTPDHLNRHITMENYLLAKEQIFINQTKDDFLILNAGDEWFKSSALKAKSTVFPFSSKQELAYGLYAQDGQMVWADNGRKEKIFALDELRINGLHNTENALAATAAGLCWGLQPEQIAKTLQRFAGVEHRLEVFAEKEGITYVNDSKGTNPASTIKALEAFNHPIVLIAGGRNKGSDFTELMSLIKQKCSYLVILGECREELRSAAEAAGYYDYSVVGNDLREATLTAMGKAHKGDIVLLSPACASWDMFANYEIRGRLFKDIVKERINS